MAESESASTKSVPDGMTTVEASGRTQGAHWKTVDGQGQACHCELGRDHDSEDGDVTAKAVPQKTDGGT